MQLPENAELDALDRALINVLQDGIPLCDEPYAAVGARLGIDAEEVLRRLTALLERGVLTRFGPLYQVEKIGGAYLLAALKAPEERFDEVAAAVNALPEVAHNYRREHAFNMWCVLAAETPAGIATAIEKIEKATGLKVFAFPKEREYFVELKLDAG
jgi:DNA-binding Lrp family transcriptional regulator